MFVGGDRRTRFRRCEEQIHQRISESSFHPLARPCKVVLGAHEVRMRSPVGRVSFARKHIRRESLRWIVRVRCGHRSARASILWGGPIDRAVAAVGQSAAADLRGLFPRRPSGPCALGPGDSVPLASRGQFAKAGSLDVSGQCYRSRQARRRGWSAGSDPYWSAEDPARRLSRFRDQV